MSAFLDSLRKKPKNKPVKTVKKLDLLEVSLVDTPAQEGAVYLALKNAGSRVNVDSLCGSDEFDCDPKDAQKVIDEYLAQNESSLFSDGAEQASGSFISGPKTSPRIVSASNETALKRGDTLTVNGKEVVVKAPENSAIGNNPSNNVDDSNKNQSPGDAGNGVVKHSNLCVNLTKPKPTEDTVEVTDTEAKVRKELEQEYANKKAELEKQAAASYEDRINKIKEETEAKLEAFKNAVETKELEFKKAIKARELASKLQGFALGEDVTLKLAHAVADDDDLSKELVNKSVAIQKTLTSQVGVSEKIDASVVGNPIDSLLVDYANKFGIPVPDVTVKGLKDQDRESLFNALKTKATQEPGPQRAFNHVIHEIMSQRSNSYKGNM